MRVSACSMLCVLGAVSVMGAQTRTGMINVGDAQLHYEVSGAGPALVLVNATVPIASRTRRTADFLATFWRTRRSALGWLEPNLVLRSSGNRRSEVRILPGALGFRLAAGIAAALTFGAEIEGQRLARANSCGPRCPV